MKLILPTGNLCILCKGEVMATPQGHRVSVWCEGCISFAETLREVGFDAFVRAWNIIKDVRAMDWPDSITDTE